MPALLLFTIPLALIIAILIGIGRLSRDNEYTVLKACGLSLHQIAAPVVAAALIAFFLAALTSFFLIPKGNLEAKNLLFRVVKQKASVGIKEKVFNDDFPGILLYADKAPVSGDYLEGVLISDQRLGTEPSTIIARRAYLISDPGSLTVALRLEGGSIHTVDRNLKNYRKMDFALYDVKLDLGSTVGDGSANRKVSTEMSAREILERLRGGSLKEEDRRELAIELHKKLSIPASCLVFSILAVPLGIRRQRSAKSHGFTVALIVILSFYLLRLSGEALAETGRLPVVPGVWLPIVLFGIFGLILFFLVYREIPLRRLWSDIRRRKS